MTRLRCLRQLRRGRLPLSVIAAIVAAVVLVWPNAPTAQASGRVTGTVKLTLATSAPSSASAYERRAVGPRPKPQSEIKNVVIFFTDLPAAKVAPMQASIAQKDEQFAPHLVAVTAGSTVAFPNEDPFFHNVFSLSKGASFNLGRYPSGSSRSRTFPHPGIVKVFCEIHSHMTATIMVFNHPWFTMVGEDGRFELANVPPGQRDITAWHERLGDTTVPLRVESGRTTEADFVLPVPAQ